MDDLSSTFESCLFLGNTHFEIGREHPGDDGGMMWMVVVVRGGGVQAMNYIISLVHQICSVRTCVSMSVVAAIPHL